jgi:phenylalanyl-tRNA synthetase beta chain
MLVPLSWLKDYVDLPANPATLVERLTLAGLESPGVRVLGLPVPAGLAVKADDATPVWKRDKVIVAQVSKIEKHPDADKLKLVTVDTGSGSKTVVTGAPNIAPGQSGMKVILGLQGTKYYYTDKDGKKTIFTLEPKALRGIMNDAMCMSNFELGIAEDHDGIIILDDSDPAPGTAAADVLGDIIVELDVLPNMARCLGLLGIAREVAALTGKIVRTPAVAPITARGTCTIAIANTDLSKRYIGIELSGAAIGPAPRWMRSRLLAAGMRPISNIVDITNYVMLETSQPLHAFDLDVLRARAGGQAPIITVRPASPGESLTTLDGVVRSLSPENLVIADSVGPIALAGVMGGLETEVTAKTTAILLESAQFDFVSVRKTARQLNLFSEASTRFSRGLQAEGCLAAGLRAAHLIAEHAGAMITGIVDFFPAPNPPLTIELNRSEIERLVGTLLPDAEVERILLALDCTIAPTMWGWSVTPPANRTDIQCGAADLIEDLVRIIGYDRLPEWLLAQEMPAPVANPRLDFEEHLRDRLVEAGLHECITYSLTDPTLAAANRVMLKNPISPERSVLRTSLRPELCIVAQRNLESNADVAIFEIGPVFVPTGGTLPDEPRRLAIVLAGKPAPATWSMTSAAVDYDFFDLKGIVEMLLAASHVSGARFNHAAGIDWLHPAQSASVAIGDAVLGHFGALHPRAAAAAGLAGKTVFIAEFDVDAIQSVLPPRWAYRPFSTFPAAKRDVAVIVPMDLPAETVLAEIRMGGGDLLADVELFDVYVGETIPAGTKSLAVAISYQAADRTLGDKEIIKAHEKIENRLRHVLKAQIRGKD